PRRCLGCARARRSGAGDGGGRPGYPGACALRTAGGRDGLTRRRVAALAAGLAMFVSGCGSSKPRNDETAFLNPFVGANGRVVRRDQGGDTVSEGQAYAMLIAVATGRRSTFERVWRWTRVHLQRPDGLLSWHWQDGKVSDAQPAADADLDAAHAL